MLAFLSHAHFSPALERPCSHETEPEAGWRRRVESRYGARTGGGNLVVGMAVFRCSTEVPVCENSVNHTPLLSSDLVDRQRVWPTYFTSDCTGRQYRQHTGHRSEYGERSDICHRAQKKKTAAASFLLSSDRA